MNEKTKKVLKYWEYLSRFSQIKKVEGEKFGKDKNGNFKTINEKKYLIFKEESIKRAGKYNFSELKKDIEVVYGNIKMSYLYDLIEIEEKKKN